MKCLLNGEYKYIINDSEKIGEGSFATVYKGFKHSTANTVAIKVMEKKHLTNKFGPSILLKLKNEIKILESTLTRKNPYIVKFYDSCETANNIYLITEYCEGGTLDDIWYKLEKSSPKYFMPEIEVLEILYQVILGLSILSDNNIVHRDIKPENILINKGYYKIGDFGFAKEVFDIFETKLGTLLYMAPEFHNNTDKLTPKVDVWAIGCILHQFLFKKHPYAIERGTAKEMMDLFIGKYQVPEHIRSDLSEKTKN